MASQDSGKWKSKLLSSSFPLEWEVAKLLASREFAVSADFPYQRRSEGTLKEFTVDVHAHTMAVHLKRLGMHCDLELLIECKFRHPGITWLFAPDPNVPDASPAMSGYALRAIDAFSMWFLHDEPREVDHSFPLAYKGVEIDANNGSVHDSEIRHGIAQLQYALPPLLWTRFLVSSGVNPIDNSPYFYSAILVTNARLMVAYKKFSVRTVQEAKSVADLGRDVPCVGLFTETGPEFESHVTHHLRKTPTLMERDAFKYAEEVRRKAKLLYVHFPSAIAQRLAAGGSYIKMRHQFSHFFVCNVDYLPTLLTSIRKAVVRSARTIRDVPPKHQISSVEPPAG